MSFKEVTIAEMKYEGELSINQLSRFLGEEVDTTKAEMLYEDLKSKARECIKEETGKDDFGVEEVLTDSIFLQNEFKNSSMEESIKALLEVGSIDGARKILKEHREYK